MNIGGGTNASIKNVLDILSSCIGPLKVKYIERQAGDAKRTSADTSKAKERIRFNPKVGLEEGLFREVEWLKVGSLRSVLRK